MAPTARIYLALPRRTHPSLTPLMRWSRYLPSPTSTVTTVQFDPETKLHDGPLNSIPRTARVPSPLPTKEDFYAGKLTLKKMELFVQAAEREERDLAEARLAQAKQASNEVREIVAQCNEALKKLPRAKVPSRQQ